MKIIMAICLILSALFTSAQQSSTATRLKAGNISIGRSTDATGKTAKERTQVTTGSKGYLPTRQTAADPKAVKPVRKSIQYPVRRISGK
jgi:hypothetical protein